MIVNIVRIKYILMHMQFCNYLEPQYYHTVEFKRYIQTFMAKNLDYITVQDDVSFLFIAMN